MEVALLTLCNPVESGAVPLAAAPVVDDGRLASLEAKLSQMAAKLAARPAAPDQPAAKTAAIPQQSVRPMPIAASVQEVQAVPITASDAEVWDKLLQALKERKMPAYACVSQGQFAGMTETQFLVKFQGILVADLAMRNYRTLIEEILQELTGRSLRLHCSGENTPVAPPPRPVPKKKTLPPLPPEEPGIPVDLDSMPPEERAPLEKAFEIFGDHVVEIEEDNK